MGCGPGGTHGGDVKLSNNPEMGNQNAYGVEQKVLSLGTVLTGEGLFFWSLKNVRSQKIVLK